MKKHIPNILTLGNVLCGCLVIICLFIGKLNFIIPLMLFAIFFDFFDGMIARALNVSSPIGKELDSLADMISFGVVPGMLMLALVAKSLMGDGSDIDMVFYLNSISNSKEFVIILFPLIITLFSALRLAKFNISENQTKEFMGLATPAATFFVVGLFFISLSDKYNVAFLDNFIVLNSIALVLAILLISNIPMFSFKLDKTGSSNNKIKIFFVISSVFLFVFFNFAAIPFIIMVYITINLTTYITNN